MSERQHTEHCFPKSPPYYTNTSNPSAICVYHPGIEEEKDSDRKSEGNTGQLHSEIELERHRSTSLMRISSYVNSP